MSVAGQWNIGVICVQKGRNGVHLYVFKGSAHDVRSNGVEGLPACLLLGLALHHLPQAENHAADDNQHKVAAQDHTCHSDHPAQQRENLAAQLAALAFAQLLRQLFICHVRFLFCHILLLIPPRPSGQGFPLSDPADCPYRSARQ